MINETHFVKYEKYLHEIDLEQIRQDDGVDYLYEYFKEQAGVNEFQEVRNVIYAQSWTMLPSFTNVAKQPNQLVWHWYGSRVGTARIYCVLPLSREFRAHDSERKIIAKTSLQFCVIMKNKSHLHGAFIFSAII